MLLSIIIPAYERPNTLRRALESFVEQIDGRYADDVEIIVVDDASPSGSLSFVQDEFAQAYPFVTYRRHPQNIGLEKNLIACSETAKGEFLWIFGDDDFLEAPDAMDQIMGVLREGAHDFIVVNRTRREKDPRNLITSNWMKVAGNNLECEGLREFCLVFGFISVIGFISANIFRRQAFAAVDPTPYMGSMYPQLGMMLEAFHSAPTILMADPLICQRTETQAEKRLSLGGKASEQSFMSDVRERDALYFSHPFARMLNRLIDCGAFLPEDITSIRENTVIDGRLIDFLIGTLAESNMRDIDPENWIESAQFLKRLPLTVDQSERAKLVLDEFRAKVGETHPVAARINSMTISVVSPSFNQADYLPECLQSVRDQTVKPIEHLVFDPGSSDGSRDIAKSFEHVTLIAEPDEGQSDALNKGFARSRGDIIAWVNSDDVFADPSVFQRVLDRFAEPDQPDIVYGKGIYIGENGERLRDVYINKDPESLHWRFQQEDGILQPALFMKRSVINRVGPLSNHRHYSMDYEYWIRCMKAGLKFAFVDENFALARYHQDNKTFGQRGNSYNEVCDMMLDQFGYVNRIWIERYAEFLSDNFDGVLAHGANTKRSDEGKYQETYKDLLRKYNGSHLIWERLKNTPDNRGMADTLREMKRLGATPPTPCKEVPATKREVPGHTLYNMGGRRWAFDAEWKKRQIERSHDHLKLLMDFRKSDVCVIVGNGPSLRKENLDLLQGQDVIISNNAFLDKTLRSCATYYTVVNYLVAEQSSHNINMLEGPSKVVPFWLSYCLNESPNTFFVDAIGKPEFSKDILKNMSWRHTVTFFNMHLAYGLGYKRAVMIGFDHYYRQQSGVTEGEIILSNAKDANHFDPAYFMGKKWQAADVNKMEEMYLLAKDAFAEDGREIVNATIGGALEIFPRMELEDALNMATPSSDAVQFSDQAEKASRLALEHAAGSENATAEWEAQDGHPRSVHAGVDETEVVSRLLSERRGRAHTLIDVGAHFGTSAAFFHDLGWTIHCFEPDASNREKLVNKFGSAGNVTIDPRAVSDQVSDSMPFFTSDESTGISGLHAFRETHSITDTVAVTTLTEIVREQGIEQIDFLKIDVEGFDFAVLKGVPWEDKRPDVIECEFEDAKTLPLGHSWRDVAEFLESKGYSVYVSEWHPIIRYGTRHDWRRVVPFKDATLGDDAWGNLLAFREDPGYDAVETAFDDLVKFSGVAGGETKVEAGSSLGSNAVDGRAGQKMSRKDKFRQRRRRLLNRFWERRRLTIPAAVVVVGLILAAIFVESAAIRTVSLVVLGSAIVFAGVQKSARRRRKKFSALSTEVDRLRRQVERLESVQRLGQEQVRVILEKQRESIRNSRVAPPEQERSAGE